MKKQIIIFLVLVAAFAFISCSDMLDEPPKSTTTADAAIENLKDAQTALNGTYAVMRDYWSRGGIVLGDVMTNETFAARGYSDHKAMQAYTYSSSDPEVKDIWLRLYTAINSANNILFKIDALSGSTTTKNDIKGQALTLRAVAYMELTKWFATPYTVDSTAAGVPIKQTSNANEKPQRSNVKEVYAYIETDLLSADKLLTTRTSTSSESLKSISSWSVKSFLARFYLYKGNYSKAIVYSSEVISGNRFTLYTNASSLKNMWTNDEGAEIIFMLGYTITNAGGLLANDYYKLRIETQNGQSVISKIPSASYVPSTAMLNLYSQFGTANNTKTSATDIRFQDSVYFTSKQTLGQWGTVLCYKYPGNPTFNKELIVNVSMPKILRIAELYLIRAEAYAYSGNDGAARTDYNYLRSQRIQGYNNETALSGNLLKQEIFNERLRELCFEGHYWFDLKRMQKGFTRTPTATEQGYVDITAANLSIPANSHRWLLPIPNDEVKGNPSIEVNPGY